MTIDTKMIGVKVPEIILPKPENDFQKWAVVACDQYTSQPEYWKDVENFVGDSPSTLNLICPEVYLHQGEKAVNDRIKLINSKMAQYLEDDIFDAPKACLILVDRKTSQTDSRKGLVMAIDLEHYDYNAGATSLTRATEGTVLDRIPPRLKVRENASLELSHVMLLIDDPAKSVVEPLFDNLDKLEKVYDFNLMIPTEHIKGYRITDTSLIDTIMKNLSALADPKAFQEKYGVDEHSPVLLFAAGDGNHSLATAKAHWENIKKSLPADKLTLHPARYALVEVVNVHDSGLTFEPIHRVLFNCNINIFEKKIKAYFSAKGISVSLLETNSLEEAKQKTSSPQNQIIPFTCAEKVGVISVPNPLLNLEVGTLQDFIDDLLKRYTDSHVDYIHGENVVKELGNKPDNIGFLLPAMDKNDLFKTVILDGALPRKTFSMGEAEEKRFYLEARKIK